MRCKICGYDVEAPLTKCPMCGGAIEHSSEVLQFAEREVQPEELDLQPESQAEQIPEQTTQTARTFVPAWGEQKTSRSADIESISWDTKDFPMPKKVEDIEIQWPEYTKHSIFSAFDEPKKTEKPLSEEVSKEPPVYEKKVEKPLTVRDADALAAKYENKAAAIEPEIPKDPAARYERAEDLAAKYESAESLAEKYENIAEPAAEKKAEDPVAVSEPEAPQPIKDLSDIPEFAVSAPAHSSADAESDTKVFSAEHMSNTKVFSAAAGIGTENQSADVDSNTRVFVSEVAANTEAPADEKTKTIKVEDLIPVQKDPERPMFYTFQTKTDEFQKLLDKEYERIHSMYGEDYDPMKGATVPPFEPEEKVQAQSLSDFERMLMEDVPEQKEQTPAQRFFSQSPTEGAAEGQPIDFNSEEWTSELEDPSRMTIEQIEDTIRQLEEEGIQEAEQSSERKKRLAAMAAARDEYFKNLDKYDKKGRLIKKKGMEAEPVSETKPAELTAEELVELRDVSEPADTIIRDISKNSYSSADDFETVEPSAGTVEPASEAADKIDVEAALSESPRSFDEIYQSIFGVKPVLSDRKEPEKPETAEPVIPENSPKLTPEEEMEKKLADIEKLYSVDEEPQAKTHNSPAISFFFDKETPQEIMSADKVSDVNELIEEQPLEKDAFSITNETSSLAFLYDDVPADADSEILTKEQLGKLETEIPLDSTWAEIWEKPSDTAEPEASESAELSDTSELQDQPETAEDQSKTAEQPSVIIEKQPELFEEPETAEKQQDIFVQSDTVEQPEVYEQSAEEPAQLPEESDVKIFEKKKRTEAKIENTAEKADDDKEVTTSSHVILKIIAVLLVLCALFEGATLVLANVAPDAGITQNLLGIEESVVGSISSFFSGIFGGGK